MSRLSRDEGLRAARALVAAHRDLGIEAERVLLSGAARRRSRPRPRRLYHVIRPNQVPQPFDWQLLLPPPVNAPLIHTLRPSEGSSAAALRPPTLFNPANGRS